MSNTNNDSTTLSSVTKPSTNTLSSNNNINNNSSKLTWIPLSLSPAEYEKMGFEAVISSLDQKRFEFVNQTKGNYKRTVTSIKKIRTDDNKVWLDWNETREGKTGIGRKLTPLTVTSVGKKSIPVPKEETVFNEQYESYDVKTTVGRETREEYWLPFSVEALQELLKDVNPYRTEYIIKHENTDSYSATQEELKESFDKVYSSKVEARSSGNKTKK
ncbi:MAG: hypothetical protein L0H53_04485 [Candidatus Nitrosocosmicus sp.]|nr:hypothetical protein [Candidatus Nitrosocosmicus sp.]